MNDNTRNEANTDKQLYKLCKKYGADALEARRKFAGLLPEVYQRRLYEKKGFGSIYEFAAKLAGMSREQVDKVIRLERNFEDKPVLKEALVRGEVSSNKLIRVASIATPKDQEELLEKTKQLSTRALEVFVQDIKKQDGSSKPEIVQKSLHVQTLELDEDIENQLAELQQKGIDVNEFLRECLKKRTQEIEEEKEKLSKEAKPTKSRYIKVDVKRLIKKEHGTKCSISGCNKPAKVLHHINRFALSRIHDPNYISPQCDEHHEISHSTHVTTKRSGVCPGRGTSESEYRIDQKFHQSKQRAIEFR